MHKLKKPLLIMAFTALSVAFVLLAIISSQREEMLTDNGQTRAAVEETISRIIPQTAASIADETLRAGVEELSAAPYVSVVWLVSSTGEILIHDGGVGEKGDNVVTFKNPDTVQLVDALPAGTLSDAQKIQILAVGAMRSEGEHNDVFKHLAHPLYNAQGDFLGVIVTAYDVSGDTGQPGAGYKASLLLWILCVAFYWLALPAWVYLDARERGEASVLWALFILASNLVGFMAYLIATKKPAQ